MRIGIFGVTAKPGLRRDALMALAEGLSTSGHHVDWVDGGEYRKCELAVIYGYPGIDGKGRRHEVRRRLLTAHNAPILILETPLFGRKVPSLKRSFLPFFSRRPDEVFDRFRVSLNGCFWDDGIFCHEPYDDARWSRLQADLGLTVSDYRKSGKDVLIIGQVPGDASLRGLDIIAWMKETAIALTSVTDRPIVIRPHPRCDHGALRRIRSELAAWHQVGWDIALGRTIRQALHHAWVRSPIPPEPQSIHCWRECRPLP